VFFNGGCDAIHERLIIARILHELPHAEQRAIKIPLFEKWPYSKFDLMQLAPLFPPNGVVGDATLLAKIGEFIVYVVQRLAVIPR
jgi:hypothetical protein